LALPRSTVELGRVVSLAVAALMELGFDHPSDHVFVAGIGNLATVNRIARAIRPDPTCRYFRTPADKLRFTVLASPGPARHGSGHVDMLTAQDLQDLNARAARHFLDVSPADRFQAVLL